MSEIKWIKLQTDIFDNRKIKQLERLPDGDTLIVIWLKILVLAGSVNDGGLVYFTQDIPYTDQLLATEFNRPLTTVQLALQTFQQFGMIEIINDLIHVSNWERYQNVDRLSEIREYNRLAKQKSREKQKMLVQVNDMSMTCQSCHETDKELEKEIEKESENVIVSNETIRCTRNDVQRVMSAWNELGLAQIKKIMPDTKRGAWLRKRIQDYGVDTVISAIDNVRHSKFLMGDNKNGWVITFDWFIRPNNFPKVLEGNYDATQEKRNPKYMSTGKQTGLSDSDWEKVMNSI